MARAFGILGKRPTTPKEQRIVPGGRISLLSLSARETKFPMEYKDLNSNQYEL